MAMIRFLLYILITPMVIATLLLVGIVVLALLAAFGQSMERIVFRNEEEDDEGREDGEIGD